jgi:hypothetical protein
MTLCFTPEHLGIARHYTSPPKNPQDFAEFVSWAVKRYAPGSGSGRTAYSGRGEEPIDLTVGAR